MERIDAFYALSAPIRREILKLLSDNGQLTATSIAKKFQVSPPAISQHLKVLLGSNLVAVHREAQKRIYSLNADAVNDLETWANELANHLNSVSQSIQTKDSKEHTT